MAQLMKHGFRSACKFLGVTIGQAHHRWITQMVRYQEGVPTHFPIPPLDEKEALHSAGCLIKDLSVLTVGAAAIFLEYRRRARLQQLYEQQIKELTEENIEANRKKG